MDCAKARNLLDLYLDHELDPEQVGLVNRHLELCSACKKMFDSQSALKGAIRQNATYYPAPAELASRVRARLGQVSAQRPAQTPQHRWKLPQWNRWLQLGAAVAATVIVTTMATLHLNSLDEEQAVAEQVMNGHARSILTSHQVDVASSDQHTVKPWLSSKLDFSPPVTDLTTTGFPLRGGRLDYIESRSVAVLIYGHRQHVIDLFIWPAARSHEVLNRSRTLAKNGFNMVHWNDSGMTYWAISDLNIADLKAFADSYTSAK